MTSESFFEYKVNVFYPWLIQQNIEFPVILYMDGHSLHFTLPLSTFCRVKSIILIALFPNSTQVIQPLDRTFFRTLKKAWGQAVEDFKREKCTINIKKEDFGNILKTALGTLDLKTIMKNGFEVCGLSPFNADKVNYALLKYRNAENISNKNVENLNLSMAVWYRMEGSTKNGACIF
nr:PREDICTED: uncharacterized protein LOC105679239 [Linepithema humile]